ncbi:MAG: hypothetical protein FD167_4431, partial [bacterium]
MFITLYKPNFCSDCGIKLCLDNWHWQQKFLLSAYFCIICAKRLKFSIIKHYFLLSAFLILLALSIKEYSSSQPPSLNNSVNKTILAPTTPISPYNPT